MATKERKLVGEVGVDSGQLILTDPCYIHGQPFEADGHDSAGVDLNAAESPRESYAYSYGGACAASSNSDGGGQLAYKLGHAGAGVCVSTGYGDGGYPVYVEYGEEGRVARVTVEFM